MTIIAWPTRNLLATDLGKQFNEGTTTAHVLTIDTTASSAIAWVPGSFFLVSKSNTGASTVVPISGAVTIVNTGAKALVQDDTPLVYQMGQTTDRWLVL